MTKNLKILTLFFFILLAACNNSKPTPRNKVSTIQIDTTNAVKICEFWAIPKPSFELNSLLDSYGDTLKLVTCNEFVYFPFGQLKSKRDLAASILKNFKILDKYEKMENGNFEFQFLTLNSNRLILFFDNDPDAINYSYIFKGEINDSEVNFTNGIKINMTKEDFINTFFDSFPNELLKKYKYIELISCLDNITHIYKFNDNKLQSIKFITDSYWTVNYLK